MSVLWYGTTILEVQIYYYINILLQILLQFSNALQTLRDLSTPIHLYWNCALKKQTVETVYTGYIPVGKNVEHRSQSILLL